MPMDNKQYILTLLEKFPMREKDIASYGGISRSTVHSCLHELAREGYIEKRRRLGGTHHYLVEDFSEIIAETCACVHNKELLLGNPAFTVWAKDNLGDAPLEKKREIYETHIKAYKEKELHELTLPNILDLHLHLEGVFCADTEYIHIGESNMMSLPATLLEILNKTQTGKHRSLSLKTLLEKSANSFAKSIHKLIQEKEIDAVAFIPPTNEEREIDIAHILKYKFDTTSPHKIPALHITRSYGDVTVIKPQKSIPELKERIRNAEETFRVSHPKTMSKNLLLIDDFIGSGATVSAIARKCKRKRIAEKVYAAALVGTDTKKFTVTSFVQ